MSILQPNEIPKADKLRAMPADVLKHTANMYLMCYRILRSEYLTLRSALYVLKDGRFPETWDPPSWEWFKLREKEDDWQISVRPPLDQLNHMDLMSKIWFEKWGRVEAEVKMLRPRLESMKKEGKFSKEKWAEEVEEIRLQLKNIIEDEEIEDLRRQFERMMADEEIEKLIQQFERMKMEDQGEGQGEDEDADDEDTDDEEGEDGEDGEDGEYEEEGEAEEE